MEYMKIKISTPHRWLSSLCNQLRRKLDIPSVLILHPRPVEIETRKVRAVEMSPSIARDAEN